LVENKRLYYKNVDLSTASFRSSLSFKSTE